MKPTEQQFENYQLMFDYFNKRLFGHQLPNIILNLSRRTRRTGGFFVANRWHEVGVLEEQSKTHEISLNPDCCRKDPKHTVSVLVHEMVHLWQEEFGETSRGGYHNKQWGDKMEEVGLMPSNTGNIGGKRNGQQMTHYIIKGGKFDLLYSEMDKSLLLPFEQIALSEKLTGAKTKTKYSCSCGTNVWGKEGLKITCGECGKGYKKVDKTLFGLFK